MLYTGGGEASKGKELGKGEDQVKDNLVSEGDLKQMMLLHDLLEEGDPVVNQKGEDQEGDK